MQSEADMKREIAKNEYYEAYVDEEVNRMYWVMRGHWKKLSDVPDFRKHNRETIGCLKPGFTAVIDMREMEIPGAEVLDLMLQVTRDSEEAGKGRQAHIINKEDMEAVRASRGVMKEADMDLKMMQFGTFEEAIEWLNR